MYGRKYMGVMRRTFLIDAASRIIRIWPKVRVPGHAQDVLLAARGPNPQQMLVNHSHTHPGLPVS